MVKDKIYLAEFTADESPYIKKLKDIQEKTERATNKIDLSFKKIGTSIASYFSARELYQFGKDAVELGTKLKGVESGFNRLKGAENILMRLRKATQGTVSDLQLMQAAVKADNFKIPLDLLSKGLEFANKRAIQTGESVEYMVDSFITGVARKSIPILDNLGISQLELNNEIKKTGDFYNAIGTIVARENQKMSGAIDKTVLAQNRLNATFENTKADLGKNVLPYWSGLLGIVNELVSKFGNINQFMLGGGGLLAVNNDLAMQQMYGGNTSASSGPAYGFNSFDSLVSGNRSALDTMFKNSTPIKGNIGSGNKNKISDWKNAQSGPSFLSGYAGMAGAGGPNEGFDLISKENIDEVTQMLDDFDNTGTSFVDKFGQLNSIANQFGNLLGIGADTFVGKIISGMDTASQILSLITSIVGFASGGPITSFLAMPGLAEGGTVINKGGKLSYVPIPKFARGGSYKVPPGYSNDSGLIRVQSGERVDVTPSNQVPVLSKLLTQIDNKLAAANLNNTRGNGKPIVVQLTMDSVEVTKRIITHQNRLDRAGLNFQDLQ